jgi:hypothetical protein
MEHLLENLSISVLDKFTSKAGEHLKRLSSIEKIGEAVFVSSKKFFFESIQGIVLYPKKIRMRYLAIPLPKSIFVFFYHTLHL